jgi:hypothetical protein
MALDPLCVLGNPEVLPFVVVLKFTSCDSRSLLLSWMVED